METLATMAVFALQPPCAADQASVVVQVTAPVLRRMITCASAFLDSGGRQLPDDAAANEAEIVIETIIGTHSGAATADTDADAKTEDHTRAAESIRILVVEDDHLLRELYRKALQRAGYQVLTADTGEKALTLLREWGERIGWLFVDIRLPGLIDGWVVGSEFSLNHPLRPVVYGSGYEPVASRQVPNSVFLQKPINLGELVAAFKGLSARYELQSSRR
jgi:CheY-like chemotaxis protein